MPSLVPDITLNNGVTSLQFGFGVCSMRFCRVIQSVVSSTDGTPIAATPTALARRSF